MEKTAFKFIVRYSMRQQIMVLAVTLFSLPFYYLSLEIPKKIINRALKVPEDAAQTAVAAAGDATTATGDAATAAAAAAEPYVQPFDIFGIDIVELERLPLLAMFCALYFVLVLVNGGFKYYINVFKGLLGERMLRRLRYQLYSRILRFPLPHFRKVSQGELIPMITAEVEPLGGFIGDAFTLPVYQGGLLITALIFIMAQDWKLGLMALMFYPVQGYVIPKLQRKVNLLGKERVRHVRKLAERIGETVSGAQEIHANDTGNYELADFSHRLGDIFRIRFNIFRKKFFVKFLNNFINQFTPLMFFSVGGYLVIEGDLSLGALVAVMGAQKDIASPWKELLNFYQIQADAKIKYDQVVSQFEPAGMRDEEEMADDDAPPEPLSGNLAVANLSLTDDDVKIIDGVSFNFSLHERVAVVGASGSGKEELALVLSRLIDPTGGRIDMGGKELGDLPEAVTGHRMAFAGAAPFFVSASVGENLIYGLKHRPLIEAEHDDESLRQWRLRESELSGNSTADITADWVDYGAAGVDGHEALTAESIRSLAVAEMITDVYDFGLRGTIDPAARPDVAERILAARVTLRERLAAPDCAGLVESFDRESYNTNSTVAENLLFGTQVGDTFDVENLADNPYIRSTLDDCGLTDDLLRAGHHVAVTMLEIFSDLAPDHEFFEQFSFIQADELPDYKDLIGRADIDDLSELDADDQRRLLALPLKLIPARHRLGVIEDDMQARLLEARAAFAENMPDDLHDAIEFFDAARYNAAGTLQDNILFGKLVFGQAQAESRVGGLISEVIDELGLRDTVVEVGLDFQVGIGGSRLSTGQRQKLAIARAVLKRPDVFIVSEGTAALDGATQTKVTKNLLEAFKGRGLIWILHRPSLASQFDRVLVMRGGHVAEQGEYEELNQPDSHLTELVAAE